MGLAIILTHGHGDHTGGVKLWKEAGTEVIADALKVRLQALVKLRAGSRNSNERGWLDYSIRTTKQRMQ